MDETTISVARNGAGAKKCRGPAPGEITNKLSIRNISFYSGAGSHEKTAPAPPWQSTCATLTQSHPYKPAISVDEMAKTQSHP